MMIWIKPVQGSGLTDQNRRNLYAVLKKAGTFDTENGANRILLHNQDDKQNKLVSLVSYLLTLNVEPGTFQPIRI